jgi:hypothetical protein
MTDLDRTDQTLVGVIRETGWWPSDLESRYKDPETGKLSNVGQYVVLERVDLTDDSPPVRWEVRSEKTDSSSLPMPFDRHDMVCGLTDLPTFCTVVVAADRDATNPVTDCCALVPFGLNDVRLTAKGRIDLGQQAIVACLKITGRWPVNWKKYVSELFPESIWLEPGNPIVYEPAEWITDREGVYRDEIVSHYLMRNTRTNVIVAVGIAVAKEKRPESIDPYRDCWAIVKKPPLGTRILMRSEGFSAPSTELCRAAISVYLHSLGVWPPDANTGNILA